MAAAGGVSPDYAYGVALDTYLQDRQVNIWEAGWYCCYACVCG